MNNIERYDANFKALQMNADEVEFINARDIDGAIYGLTYSEEEKLYRRMPKNVADSVSDGVKNLSYHSAGGRIKIKTNSPYLVIRAEVEANGVMNNMSISGQWGFSIKENGLYHGVICPTGDDIFNQRGNKVATFQGMRYIGDGEHDLTIFTPLYNRLFEVYIGVKKGSYVEKGSDYLHKNPVLFYGSSITQGGCATTSSNSYINIISEQLNTDVLNLGFSGNAKGEKVMCDYLASLSPSIFVIDYDHNAPDYIHLQNTHYPLYKTIRDKHPTTPIILVSRPDVDRDYIEVDGVMREPVTGFDKNADKAANRRIKVIKDTYDTAIKNGDNNVYFICGSELIPAEIRKYAFVDTCHPNDLGFYYMAKNIGSVIKQILDKDHENG